MSNMSMEMIQNNVIDWLDEIVTGVKASRRAVQCVPTYEVERNYASYGQASIAQVDSILLHGFDHVVSILCPEVHYCRRRFYIDYGQDEAYKNHAPYAKYFEYHDVIFFDYIHEREVENARKQNSNLGAFEELPVVDL